MKPTAMNDQLVQALQAFEPSEPLEARHRERILHFARTHANPFNRSHLHAHLTSSALIVNADGTRTLLGHHRKLDKWLQLGGHGERGETCPEQVAMREAAEESGISGLQFHPVAARPFDVDIHQIPVHGDVPAHLHLDIRYLLVASSDALPQRRPDEHRELRWFSWDEAQALDLDPSLVRLISKAWRLLDPEKKSPLEVAV